MSTKVGTYTTYVKYSEIQGVYRTDFGVQHKTSSIRCLLPPLALSSVRILFSLVLEHRRRTNTVNIEALGLDDSNSNCSFVRACVCVCVCVFVVHGDVRSPVGPS